MEGGGCRRHDGRTRPQTVEIQDIVRVYGMDGLRFEIDQRVVLEEGHFAMRVGGSEGWDREDRSWLSCLSVGLSLCRFKK